METGVIGGRENGFTKGKSEDEESWWEQENGMGWKWEGTEMKIFNSTQFTELRFSPAVSGSITVVKLKVRRPKPAQHFIFCGPWDVQMVTTHLKHNGHQKPK